MGELEILICFSSVSLFNTSKPGTCFRVLQFARCKEDRLVRAPNTDMSVSDEQPCKFKEDRLVRALNADIPSRSEESLKVIDDTLLSGLNADW